MIRWTIRTMAGSVQIRNFQEPAGQEDDCSVRLSDLWLQVRTVIDFTPLFFCSACSYDLLLYSMHIKRASSAPSQAAPAEAHHRRQAGERRRESSCAVCLCDFERRLFRSLEEPLHGAESLRVLKNSYCLMCLHPSTCSA